MCLAVHFLWRWYCGKKQIAMWFIMVCTLIANEYASLLFSQTFFFYMLSESEKVFERKVWRVQVAHLHISARALSSRSKWFLSLSLIMWQKKQIKCGLAWSVLLWTTIRVITVVKICCGTIFSSDTSTKRETAIFKICPPAIITSPKRLGKYPPLFTSTSLNNC